MTRLLCLRKKCQLGLLEGRESSGKEGDQWDKKELHSCTSTRALKHTEAHAEKHVSIGQGAAKHNLAGSRQMGSGLSFL